MTQKDLKEYARHIPRRSISQEDADQLHLWSLGSWGAESSAKTVKHVEKEHTTIVVEAASSPQEKTGFFHYLTRLWARLTGSDSRPVSTTQHLTVSHEKLDAFLGERSGSESFRKGLFETARLQIAEIRTSARQIGELGDRRLRLRIEELADQMRGIVGLVEDDPRDMSLARPFLSVHFKSARDATAQFTRLYREQRRETLRTDYEELILELGDTLFELKTRLLENDENDLAVEMDVLRERLQHSTSTT